MMTEFVGESAQECAERRYAPDSMLIRVWMRVAEEFECAVRVPLGIPYPIRFK